MTTMLFHSHGSQSYLVTVNHGQMEVVEILVKDAQMEADYYDYNSYSVAQKPFYDNSQYNLKIYAQVGQSKVFPV